MKEPHEASGSGVPQNEGGFTLMEIVIALLVLGIVAVSAVKASGNAVNNLIYIKEQTFAHWVAMNKATEIILAPPGWEGDEENSGSAVMAGARWPWNFTVHDTPEAGIRRVEIEVRPEGGQRGEPAAVLSLYRRR